MRLTQSHVEFWSTRALPAWTRQAYGPSSMPGVAQALHQRRATQRKSLLHACVNAHAAGTVAYTDRRHEIAASNLLSILRSMRSRGVDLEVQLARMSHSTDDVADGVLRTKYAKRWAARLRRQRMAAAITTLTTPTHTGDFA